MLISNELLQPTTAQYSHESGCYSLAELNTVMNQTATAYHRSGYYTLYLYSSATAAASLLVFCLIIGCVSVRVVQHNAESLQ